jgi:hypothetical protein
MWCRRIRTEKRIEGGDLMFKKWRDTESNRLKQIEREFEMLKFDYELLRTDYKRLEKRVEGKEITHVQKVQVELHKPYDYDLLI